VVLRPAEIHPQEHRRPVGRLGSAGPGADCDDRAPLVVLAREQERRPFALERLVELVGVALELGRDVGVFFCEREQLDEILGLLDDARPQLDLGAQAVGFAEETLRPTLVVPEPGGLGEAVDLGYAAGFGLEVKAAPRSR
jgi:hypothetical protein